MLLIETLEKQVKVKSKIITVTFEVFAEEETETPDFDYGNELENQRELERFHSGELCNVCIKVKASYKAFSGTDYLRQCFIKSSSYKTDILETAESHDMYAQALHELAKNAQDAKATLKDL